MTTILIAVVGQSIAHTLRPLPIAIRLRELGQHVVFGGRGPYMKFLVEQKFPVIPLPMLDYARTIKMMDSEFFHLYGVSEYRSTVTSQLRYLEALQPDLVLQDGPDPALPVAAFEAGIQHINLANATVHGLAGPQRIVPFRPWLRKIIGRSEKWTLKTNNFLAQQRNVRIEFPVFVYSRQRGFTVEQLPDNTLIPDLPELFNAPTDLPGKIFIGPLMYEPEVPLPPWWNTLDEMKPTIYVGVGSSGGSTGMRTIIQALTGTEYQVILSTADTFDSNDLPANFFASRMVPRDAVLRRAVAMVYHGGSATTYQAIRHGKPMVAIPAHADHDMNARAVVERGLGLSIFPHELTAEGLRKAVDEVVNSSKMHFALKRFQLILARRDPPELGAKLLLEFARKTRPSSVAEERPITLVPTSDTVFEEIPCDLCGEKENQTEKKIEDANVTSKHLYSIVRCKNCGLIYCSPRPSPQSYSLLQPFEYHQNGSERMAGIQLEKELRTIDKLVKIDLQSKVLIAGCGAGDFAKYIQDRVGCDALCIEDHAALVKRARARGLWVKGGTLNDLPGDDCGFDTILFLNTLERASSPKGVLTSARDRLAPRGRLIIKTADITKSDASIDVPRALYGFTAKTLEAILWQTGFSEIRLQKELHSNTIWCSAAPEIR
jgi:UDP:flavonoid glycosyltransferase YjiC (YdhE family)